MITLNDYLYSGDTLLRILKKYIRDLRIEAKEKHNEIDLVHCNFLIQILKGSLIRIKPCAALQVFQDVFHIAVLLLIDLRCGRSLQY